MQAISYSKVKKNLKKYLDNVYHNHDPLIITRRNDENLVILPVEDYNSLTQTNHFLSKKNEINGMMKLSETSFNEWDNHEDEIYNNV